MTEEVIRAIVRDEIKKASPKTEEMKESCVDIRGFDPTGEGSAYQPEPAPGSDAEHPPVGYRLVEMRGKVDKASVCWKHGVGPWVPNTGWMPDDVVGPINTPIANPIPANEGDSRLAESVAIPVGWVLGFPEDANFRYWCKDEKGGGFWTTTARTCVTVRDLMIVPDPSIPWGEGHEAILPSEAVDGDEFLIGSSWIRAISLLTWSERERNEQPWRRRIPDHSDGACAGSVRQDRRKRGAGPPAGVLRPRRTPRHRGEAGGGVGHDKAPACGVACRA